RLCRRAAHREQFGRGIEARQAGHAVRRVEFHVDAAAAAEFEHIALRKRDDLAPRLHDLPLRTGAADQSRHTVTVPPTCHIALSPWRAACPLLARLATPI